jgi:hypothetical protein
LCLHASYELDVHVHVLCILVCAGMRIGLQILRMYM